MSLRYYKRLRICKGLSLGISRSGVSARVGIRGAGISIGPRSMASVGLPGTGVSYRQALATKPKGSYHHGFLSWLIGD